MMRFLLPPLLLLAAAACTPLQQCLNSADDEVTALEEAADTARGNVARGYAIHRSLESRRVPAICYDDKDDPYPCFRTDRDWVETPVAIDVADERRKLAALEARLVEARAREQRAVAQCRAAYPES